MGSHIGVDLSAYILHLLIKLLHKIKTSLEVFGYIIIEKYMVLNKGKLNVSHAWLWFIYSV
jgi:hypothetical protein